MNALFYCLQASKAAQELRVGSTQGVITLVTAVSLCNGVRCVFS